MHSTPKNSGTIYGDMLCCSETTYKEEVITTERKTSPAVACPPALHIWKRR